MTEQMSLFPEVLPEGLRGPYQLHKIHGERIMEHLRKAGSIYLGPAYGREPFTFATQAFPEVCYHSDGQGTVRGHKNACSHFKYPLIGGNKSVPGDKLDTFNWKHPGELTVCPFHSVSFDLGSGACKGLGAVKLPENLDQSILDLEKEDTLIVQNGFVFRLGDKDPEEAARSLRDGFTFIGDFFPGLFSIDGGDNWFGGGEFRSIREKQKADALTGEENFLDILHVPLIHPDSLGRLCTIDGYQSAHNDDVIVQWVPLSEQFRDDVLLSYSRTFWQAIGEDGLLQCPRTGVPLGAVWVTFRQTGLMLEWYPGVIVVSQCFPGRSDVAGYENDPRRSTFFHHFYYQVFGGEEIVDAHQELFKLTGDEDEYFCSGASSAIFNEIERGNGEKTFGFACAQYEDYASMFYRDMEKFLVQK